MGQSTLRVKSGVGYLQCCVGGGSMPFRGKSVKNGLRLEGGSRKTHDQDMKLIKLPKA